MSELAPTKTSTIKTSNGELYAEEFVPAGGPAGVVLVTHGYMEHCGRYRELARVIVDAGWACLTYDVRGHGKSPGDRGFVASFDEFLADFRLALAAAKRLAPGKPVVLLGHSHGSLITLRALTGDSPPDACAAIVSSPYLAPKYAVPTWQRVLAKVASRLVPKLTQPSPLRSEDLTHDPAKIAAHKADKLLFDKLPLLTSLSCLLPLLLFCLLTLLLLRLLTLLLFGLLPLLRLGLPTLLSFSFSALLIGAQLFGLPSLLQIGPLLFCPLTLLIGAQLFGLPSLLQIGPLLFCPLTLLGLLLLPLLGLSALLVHALLFHLLSLFALLFHLRTALLFALPLGLLTIFPLLSLFVGALLFHLLTPCRLLACLVGASLFRSLTLVGLLACLPCTLLLVLLTLVGLLTLLLFELRTTLLVALTLGLLARSALSFRALLRRPRLLLGCGALALLLELLLVLLHRFARFALSLLVSGAELVGAALSGFRRLLALLFELLALLFEALSLLGSALARRGVGGATLCFGRGALSVLERALLLVEVAALFV
jgi:pimeloyl-ACP methyl ester carboxylesterase